MKRKFDCCGGDTAMVRKSEVPAYLHSGEFFQSLSDEDDEQISVPSNVLKLDTSIENNADLEHLLCSLRFWGVSEVSEEVISFYFSDKFCDEICPILKLFKEQFPYVGVLHRIRPGLTKVHLKTAIRAGILPVVKEMRNKGHNLDGGCTMAAAAGQLHILQYIHEQGGSLDETVLLSALYNDSISCAEYCRTHGAKWPTGALLQLLIAGHTQTFIFAREHGCTWEGSVPGLLCSSDENEKLLQLALQHGYPIGSLDAVSAACNGAIMCLKLLHEAGVAWDVVTTVAAIRHGHLACLAYAHQNGCPVLPGCSQIAAVEGHLEVLQYLHEAGVAWGGDTCTAAAGNGHLECLRYAHENGAPWDERTTCAAAQGGHLHCLKYAHEQGCPITRAAWRDAKMKNRRSCVTYLAIWLRIS